MLAWYFVVVWGSGFLATKVGLQHAAPFTFLALRFAFGTACLVPIVLVARPRWFASRTELVHVLIAGLLIHVVHLGGSHYAQYLGLSAGMSAVLLSVQPLLTGLIAAHWMRQPLAWRQWAGIAVGLSGVALIVWHKIDVREATVGTLVAICIALGGMTAGTLYQRAFCAAVDLRSTALIQFLATVAVLTPLAFFFEDTTVVWSWSLAGSILFLVFGASLLGLSALHTLMRRGQAARVSSLLYLTPVIAVVLELAMFGVVPSSVSLIGIVVTIFGVALVVWPSRRASA